MEATNGTENPQATTNTIDFEQSNTINKQAAIAAVKHLGLVSAGTFFLYEGLGYAYDIHKLTTQWAPDSAECYTPQYTATNYLLGAQEVACIASIAVAAPLIYNQFRNFVDQATSILPNNDLSKKVKDIAAEKLPEAPNPKDFVNETFNKVKAKMA